MKHLPDTHIWLWSLAEPRRLSRRVQHELSNTENELWLSPASTWEALMGHARGRIRLHGNLREWVASATGHFREAPLTHEIVAAAHEPPIPHRETADRFLAATAEVLGLTLVTTDDRQLGLGKLATLANR